MDLLNSDRRVSGDYELERDGHHADVDRSISLFRLTAIYLSEWRVLVVTSVVCGLLALLIVTVRGPWYTASASFIPESANEPDLSSLAGLAGQLGVAVGGTRSSLSPDFYAAFATSPVILKPIAADTFRVSRGESPRPLVDLLKARGSTPERRLERATEKLTEETSAEFNRRTGLISLTVRTRWRDVSMSIAQRILERLNDFNLRTRQSRAKAERSFAETQANDARARLRAAEDAQRRFSIENRSIGGSPTLQLEFQRLAREVALRQQLVSSLEESFEKARLREIQDTPVITILQQPSALSVPDPRGRVKYTLLGAIAGLFLAGAYVPFKVFAKKAREERDPGAEELHLAWTKARRELFSPFKRRLSDVGEHEA
jgi:uncharacterized protein involved in exopolysaccharide biosynthesis